MRKTKVADFAYKSVDDQLTEHLRHAEHHLVAAALLFLEEKHPDRRPDYVEKLNLMQQGVTSLMRQELIRMRGPIKAAQYMRSGKR
jgi:hypothetical protein